MDKQELLDSIPSWEKEPPTPYAFRKLISTYRQLGKIEKREQNYVVALGYFNRVLSLSKIWHEVFGLKTSGIVGWEVDQAGEHLKRLKAKFGSIYSYTYLEHGPVRRDVVLSSTDYKNLESITEAVEKESEKNYVGVDVTEREQSSESASRPSEDRIIGQRVKGRKGKAKYVAGGSQEVTVEELALLNYKQSGFSGLWSENEYWWHIFAYLYWEVIYMKLEGVYEPKFGAFPSIHQDMPRDMFTSEFYTRRKSRFNKRDRSLMKFVFLSTSPKIHSEFSSSYRKHKGTPCRLIENSTRYSIEDYMLSLESLSPHQIILIMKRLYEDFNNYRSGLPDLFLVKDNHPIFIEVKREGERIAPNQKGWMDYLSHTVGLPTSICRVQDS